MNKPNDLVSKGAFIFSTEESDITSAANFLVLLLDSIEKWATTFPYYDDTRQMTQFKKGYMGLIHRNVKFPSQFKKEEANSQQSSSHGSTSKSMSRTESAQSLAVN